MENTTSHQSRTWIVLAVAILAVIVLGSVGIGLYATQVMRTPGSGTNGTSPTVQQITMGQAVQTFKNYLTTVRNPNIALHEVEEYQYNFYASYYEKDTGNFAFQMLIWKPGASYMMGMMGYSGTTGVAVPEMGPNMMWNTKYLVAGGMMSGGTMNGGGMMGGGMMGGRGTGSYSQGSSAPMTVTPDQARVFAQQYLNRTLPGKTGGDTDIYYGYYNIDVLLIGSTFGMLSVNGYTGQVWYHTWHGSYVQTVTLS